MRIDENFAIAIAIASLAFGCGSCAARMSEAEHNETVQALKLGYVPCTRTDKGAGIRLSYCSDGASKKWEAR